MSLNIKTANGLQEIGKVTKEKVIAALEYAPVDPEDLPNIQEDGSGDLYVADQNGNYVMRVGADGVHATEVEVSGMLLGETLSAHTADSEIHVTAAEKEAWNAKSGFSGVYDDLLNKPNLEDDESGNLQIVDENGNVVAQFDENGLTTTEVTAGGVKLSGTLIDHISDDTAHITEAERKAWNEKSDFSGVYSDLIGEPNITEDESGVFQITDDNGNVAVQVDNEGLKAATVQADTIIADVFKIGDQTVSELIDGVAQDLSDHENDTTAHITAAERNTWNAVTDVADRLDGHDTDDIRHITAEERESWNAKSEFSGKYEDLIGEPNIHEDDSGVLQIIDPDGNIGMEVGNDGVKAGTVTATHIVADTVQISGVFIKDKFDEHSSDTDVHVSTSEKAVWDAKATTEYVDQKVADLVDSSPATLDTLHELATALGEDPNFAATVSTQIGLKSDKAYVDEELAKKSDIGHGHTIADVSGLQSALDVKADKTELHTHDNKTVLDEIDQERVASWDNKSNFSGRYEDLEGEPSIEETNDTELSVADIDGNVVVRIDAGGVTTTTVTSKAISTDEVTADVIKFFVPVVDDDGNITGTEEVVLTDVLDTKADKADVSAELALKANAQDMTIALSGKSDTDHKHPLSDITDVSATANEINYLSGVTSGIQEQLDSKSDDGHTHSQYLEADDIAGKADAEAVDAALANKADQSALESAVATINETLSTKADTTYVDGALALKADLETVNAELANKAVKTEVDSALAEKADRSELHEHDNKTVLDSIDAARISTWDNKSDFSGLYTDLEGEPSIEETNDTELTVADKPGNIILRITQDGLETTGIKAKTVTLVSQTVDDDGNSLTIETNVEATLNEHAATLASKADTFTVMATYETKSDADDKLGEAKEYTNTVIANYVNNSDIADDLTTASAGKVLSANQGVVLQDQIDEINDILADLLYEAITFTKFTNDVGTVELGSTINTINFEWSTNKTPSTLSLDGVSIDASLIGYTYSDLGLCPTSVTTKKYTISATDDREATASKETSITFVNGVYYGVIDASATIDSDAVLAMSKKLQNSRGMTVTITPGDTEYIAFAFPSRLGTPTFKMGGFETTCNCTTIQFKNSSGFEEEYNVYTSAHTGLGKTEVVVS